jgi:hypothetical protein
MKKPTNHLGYINKPDYTTELRLHDRTVEVLKHCGRCLSIIPRKTCDHCAVVEAKDEVKKAKFHEFLDSRKAKHRDNV